MDYYVQILPREYGKLQRKEENFWRILNGKEQPTAYNPA
jgi:hypothetical protein